MERLNPSLAIERNKYEQQLADQGIRYGSPAYDNAMRNYSMQANDARLGVIGQGGQEQQRLSEMSRLAGEFGNKAQQQIYEQAKGRGEFGNQAQQQAYEQAFGRGQFYNAAQQQQFAQEAQRGTFSNAALAQNFGQATDRLQRHTTRRGSSTLDEQFALRNQPINEISALLTGLAGGAAELRQPEHLDHRQHRRGRADQQELRPADGGVEPAGGHRQHHHRRLVRLRRRAGARWRVQPVGARRCQTHTAHPQFLLRRSEGRRADLRAAAGAAQDRRSARHPQPRLPEEHRRGPDVSRRGLGENMADRRLAADEAAAAATRRCCETGADRRRPRCALHRQRLRHRQRLPAPDRQHRHRPRRGGDGAGAAGTACSTAVGAGSVLDDGQPITPVQAAQQPSMSIEEWKQTHRAQRERRAARSVQHGRRALARAAITPTASIR